MYSDSVVGIILVLKTTDEGLTRDFTLLCH